MFALKGAALFSVAEAGDRLFMPIAGQQPVVQSSENVYVPIYDVNQQLVPAGAVPQGSYVDVLPEQVRSVPMSWAFAGAALLGAGAYYAGRMATLGAGGSVRASGRTVRWMFWNERLLSSTGY